MKPTEDHSGQTGTVINIVSRLRTFGKVLHRDILLSRSL